MEQIEESLFLVAAVLSFCLAVEFFYRQQNLLVKLEDKVYRNYHQERFLEEISYE